MPKYFNINYEFDREEVHRAIERQIGADRADYICVADGVILDTANRDEAYLEVVNSGMFAICDSSFVPLYIRIIHGHRYGQYCGSQIFHDIVSSGKYRMIFLGSHRSLLDGLKKTLIEWNPEVRNMQFIELPFCSVEEFDYEAIAHTVRMDGADIVWVSLGAPKQEHFMHRLKPHLDGGVMIAVGAVFKFFSGHDEKRAPSWMVKRHMEFLFRITQEPKKQLRRCRRIIYGLPRLLRDEYRRKKNSPKK